jgi:hypothetical protein
MIKLGVSLLSLPQVIFSFGTAPLTSEIGKQSRIHQCKSFSPSLEDFLGCMDIEANAAMRGGSSELQGGLHVMQKEYDLRVINLEEFFTQQVQIELDDAGYESNVYYHASFTLGQAEVTQDIVYKRVTDMFTVRAWCRMSSL